MMLTKEKAATSQDVTRVMLRGTRRRMWDCLRKRSRHVVEGESPDGGGDEHDAVATKARCGHSTSTSTQRAGAWMRRRREEEHMARWLEDGCDG
jgi:hypothetical protein